MPFVQAHVALEGHFVLAADHDDDVVILSDRLGLGEQLTGDGFRVDFLVAFEVSVGARTGKAVADLECGSAFEGVRDVSGG